MNAKQILRELKNLGNEGTRKTLLRHGAREPLFGVRIGDMQKLRKAVGINHEVALELFESGNYDAMYFASLVADDERMTKAQLRKWAKQAYGASLSGSAVPSVAAGSPRGWDLALEWIDSKSESVAETGWNTISSLISVRSDEELDLPALRKLLARVKREIGKAPNHVRYAMNNYVIAAGSFVAPLFETAMKTAEAIGEVTIDHGATSCQTPFAPDYLKKVQSMNRVSRKRKSTKC